jgi:SAM-dependent methyltransferase
LDTEKNNTLKSEWDDRARRLGPTKRSVLFKRLPGFLNESIHRRHVGFLLKHIPPTAQNVLDVGCGYGRLSMEIKLARPQVSLYGVELSSEFSEVYNQEIGPCFNGPVEQFQAENTFDAIVLVTILMYLTPEDQTKIISQIWSYLNPGGTVICIEPAVEIVRLWRRITGKTSANPTGGTVNTYTSDELWNLFSTLDGVELLGRTSINMIPGIASTALHHGLAVIKRDATDVK